MQNLSNRVTISSKEDISYQAPLTDHKKQKRSQIPYTSFGRQVQLSTELYYSSQNNPHKHSCNHPTILLPENPYHYTSTFSQDLSFAPLIVHVVLQGKYVNKI